MLIAAFEARIVGRGLSAFGTGGGFAATCGAAASADRSFADGVAVFEGITTGGVSPNVGACPRGCDEVEEPGRGILDPEARDIALIMACR